MSEDIQAIVMPKWGLAMTEGMVVDWHVEAGAEIAAGDEILDIETTKITNAFESPASGTLRRRVAEEGETVPVGGLIGVVASTSVAEPDIDAFVERFNANFAVAAEEAAEAAPTPDLVEAAGRQINYLAMGEGAPIVLIHGFGGDLNGWLFNQAALAESGRVLALDLPGHGRSSKDVGAGDMGMLTETLAAFLDAMDIEAAHLVGHSMGGGLSLAFALEQPQRVAALTLIAPGGLGQEVNAGYIDGFVAAGRRKEMKAVLEMLVADPDQISRDMVNEVLKYKRLDGVDTALRQLADTLFPGGRQQRFPADRLATLEPPAQVIWGRDDQVLPVRHADALPATVTRHMLPDVGHMPHMEAAAEVNRLVAAFVA